MSPPTKHQHRAGRHLGNLTGNQQGFTLVELLVSMVVLSLVMLLTVQMVGSATSVTTASNKVIDAESMSRVALDRIGTDLANAAFTGGPTLLYYSGSSGSTIDPLGNSEIGFVSKARGRKINSASPAPGEITPSQDTRGIFVGYKIRPTAINILSRAPVNIPLINRGDALCTFAKSGTIGTDKFGFSLWNMLGASGTPSLVNDLVATTNDNTLLTWTGFGDGIVRFHVSFVLDDGRIVQSLQQTTLTPPLNATYAGFQSNVNGGTGDCVPVAFSAATTADLNKRYVVGMIIGIAILDETTLNVSFARDNTFVSTLSNQLKRPVNDGDTPVKVWQANLSNVTSPAVRQNVRFYQRFYSVNL